MAPCVDGTDPWSAGCGLLVARGSPLPARRGSRLACAKLLLGGPLDCAGTVGVGIRPEWGWVCIGLEAGAGLFAIAALVAWEVKGPGRALHRVPPALANAPGVAD